MPPTKEELAHIEPSLRSLAVPIESLSADPANVMTHPKQEMEELVASFRRFGQRQPIMVDGQGVTIAGAARLEAAKLCGWKWVAAFNSTLEGVERTAYAIADNRIAQRGEFDFPALSAQLRDLHAAGLDLQAIGWEPHEVEPLLQADWSPPAAQPLGDHNAKTDNRLSLEISPEQRAAIWEAIAEARRAGEPDDAAALTRIAREWLASRSPRIAQEEGAPSPARE